MQHKRWWIYFTVLLVLAILLKWYVSSEMRVENYYSAIIYPKIGELFRSITGWLPVSFGDLLYGMVVVWLIFLLIKLVKAAYKRNFNRNNIANAVKKAVIIVLWIYIIFNGFWGINYNRFGIANQLQLNMQRYSVEDLREMNALLLKKVNVSKLALIKNQIPYPSTSQLFTKVKDAYDKLGATYPFLNYSSPSLKSSIWGWLGNYTGFTGYYNPFTGEGQVNTTIPKFLQPYTACHEVAHQLGYAKEMEANFVGYLAASTSTDTLFHYSVYLDLFLYSNRTLRLNDSVQAKQYAEQLLPEVKEDLKEWRAFNKRHQNPIEPLIKWGYSLYLKNNRQPQGILAYDEVTSFLIAYYKKFGKI